MKNHRTVWSKLDEGDKWGRPLRTPPRVLSFWPLSTMLNVQPFYRNLLNTCESEARLSKVCITKYISADYSGSEFLPFPGSLECLAVWRCLSEWLIKRNRRLWPVYFYLYSDRSDWKRKEQGLVTLTFTLSWMKLLVTLLLRKHNAKGSIALRHSLWGEC